MDDREIQKKIIQIVRENDSNPYGVTKNEVARIYSQRWGTSRTTIWDYMMDLIHSGQIELRLVKKQQRALFIGKGK